MLPLIPDEMRQSVISGDWFCLGALEETSDQDKGEPDWGFEFEVIEDLNVMITEEDAFRFKNRKEKEGKLAGPSRDNGVLSMQSRRVCRMIFPMR